MEVTQVVRLCYDYGWRDKNLITIVSIAGAESTFNEKFTDEENCKYGLFGMYANGDWHVLLDAEYATKTARRVFEEMHFQFWPSFATARCLSYVDQAAQSAAQFYSEIIRKELIGS